MHRSRATESRHRGKSGVSTDLSFRRHGSVVARENTAERFWLRIASPVLRDLSPHEVHGHQKTETPVQCGRNVKVRINAAIVEIDSTLGVKLSKK